MKILHFRRNVLNFLRLNYKEQFMMKKKKIFGKIFLAALLLCAAGCSNDSRDWGYEEVIPVYLAGIESVNVDNAGQHPVITNEPVKKEAYMIGVRWVTDNSDPGGNQSITGPVEVGKSLYRDIANGYTRRIYCNTVFNSRNPAGANVSQYFKEVSYLPAGINEGFVLLSAPDPGEHSFKVVFTKGSDKFEYDTKPIHLY
jgi:hypothetical protein